MPVINVGQFGAAIISTNGSVQTFVVDIPNLYISFSGRRLAALMQTEATNYIKELRRQGIVGSVPLYHESRIADALVKEDIATAQAWAFAYAKSTGRTSFVAQIRRLPFSISHPFPLGFDEVAPSEIDATLAQIAAVDHGSFDISELSIQTSAGLHELTEDHLRAAMF